MNKKIVIIGTSRGIGRSLANYFSKSPNFEVHCLSRSKGDLPQTDNIIYHPFDLEKLVQQQISKIFEAIGTIDILINNAGLLVNKPFTELTHEDFQQSYQVNVIGVMQTTQAALPFLNPAESHIVNISSMGGFQGSVKFAGLSAYSTSKAALVSFTELFSEEYKESTIAMNCLCLGAVQTEMLAAAFPGFDAPTSSEQMASFIGEFALNQHRFFKGKILPVSLSTP
jgi:NAD(P)-dependent dehydrogenase (short-subunit alcohol dehydrogenase family)